MDKLINESLLALSRLNIISDQESKRIHDNQYSDFSFRMAWLAKSIRNIVKQS